MAYQLSPGVLVTERDLTTVVPAVATSSGGFSGKFKWGPINAPTLVSSEQELVSRFGSPDDDTATSFFTAANFLGYSNTLLNVRARAAGDLNSVGNVANIATGVVTSILISDAGTGYTAANTTITFPDPGVAGGSRAQGVLTISGGGVQSITITNPGTGYTGNGRITVTTTDVGASGANVFANVTLTGFTGQGIVIENEDDYVQTYSSGVTGKGEFAAKYAGKLGNSIKYSLCDASAWSTWAYRSEFDGAPATSSFVSQYGGSQDELHLIVIDADGAITGTANQVLEKFAYLSKASDAVKSDGTRNYYKEVINRTSSYLWWLAHATNTASNWGTSARDNANTVYGNLVSSVAVTRTLSGGANGTHTDGNILAGYEIFVNDELYDVSLIPTGALAPTQARSVVNNIAEIRKDCVVFISPELSDVQVGQPEATKTTNVTDFRTTGLTNLSSSYAVLDSGWKYQYDRYNDVYRWIPLNGDIAGLCARTDFVADPWFSPGGLNRGQIRNVVKLAFNPTKAQRDTLYKAGINPVISSPGTGTVLFGDKTLLSRPSAFDRINVRRLFIVLEKSIATAAKSQLFEFNDEFTRSQFRNLVEPFLRDVKGRRGITDYKVVCDSTNNTPEVIDRNEFVADIYVKPARSINFITLNFIATRTGISFEELTA